MTFGWGGLLSNSKKMNLALVPDTDRGRNPGTKIPGSSLRWNDVLRVATASVAGIGNNGR